MRGTKKAGPGRASTAEGGPSGVPPRVGSISTKVVTTVGTEEARTKAPAKPSAREAGSRTSTAEGGPSGVTPRVGSISTKAVTTVGTEEARKAASKLPAPEPTRRSLRIDTRAVSASIPTSENYYGNLQKHSAEEEDMQSHEQASASSHEFPEVTVTKQVAGMTSKQSLATISEMSATEETSGVSSKPTPSPAAMKESNMRSDNSMQVFMLSSSLQSPTATAITVQQSPINQKKITAEAAQGNIMTEQSPATKSKVAAKEDASMTPRTSMQAPRASPAQTPIDFIRKTVAAAAQENIRQSGMSIRTSLTFSESASPAKQSQEQIMNMVDMNKVEREDDMQISRSAGENVLASSPSQQGAEGVPAVFSFKKLRAAELSRASETTTPPRVGPNTPSPDTFFTPEMEARKDPSAGNRPQDMLMRLESTMEMAMENLTSLTETQHGLRENLTSLTETQHGLRENLNSLTETQQGLRENQNALIQTQNMLIAMQKQTEAVGQNNTKDIKQLRQQTEFKHASVMEQIHAWRDLLQSNSATAEIAQKEIHARIDGQEKAINNLSLDTSVRLHDLEQRHADIDLRRDDTSKSLKLAQLADEATTLQAAHAQSMKERMDNQEAEFVGLKKQVDSQTDLLHQLLPVQVQEAVQERFQKAKVVEARAKDKNVSSSESTQASPEHNKIDEHNRRWQGKQQQRKQDVVKVDSEKAVTLDDHNHIDSDERAAPMRESPEQLVDTVKGLKTEKRAGISKSDEEVLLINRETLKKLASDSRGNTQTAAVAEISEKVKTINELTHHNSGVEIEQMGTNKTADPIRALSERLITTYEVVVTEKEAKHDKSNTSVTEVGGEMKNNTVTKFRELEMDKNTIYNSTAVSMSEFSEVTSTAEDLKYKDKPKPSLRTWDQTLNDVEQCRTKRTFFLSILLGRNCSGRGRLA